MRQLAGLTEVSVVRSSLTGNFHSGRNAYSRGIEHLEYLEANDEDKSVLWLHSIHHHQRRPDVKYSMKVTGTFQDPLDRQIMEKIQIQNFKGPVLMNRRSEMGGVRVERMQYRRWGGPAGRGSN